MFTSCFCRLDFDRDFSFGKSAFLGGGFLCNRRCYDPHLRGFGAILRGSYRRICEWNDEPRFFEGLRGGRGTFIGTLMGAVLLTEVLNAVSFLGLSQMWQYLFQGVLILAAALAYSTARNRAQA